MKILFDSNIFISAFAIPGSQAEKAILKIIEDNSLLLISKDILGEVLRVLSTKFNRDKEAPSRTALYVESVKKAGVMVRG